MKKILFLVLLLLNITGFAQELDTERTASFPKNQVILDKTPPKKQVWVFMMAGQSNMAGRGLVEPRDTILNKRILTINQKGELIYAKEPLHFYEPNRTGLDCGMSFGKEMLNHIPKNVSILLVPTAVGGSAIGQWLGDSVYREVKLLSNFKEKAKIAQNYGLIKGILWHQGESDANEKNIPNHKNQLEMLVTKFREITGNNHLPFVIGELGSYSKTNDNWQKINEKLREYVKNDINSMIIQTQDLQHKGDSIHFNSAGQRIIGQRFAQAFSKLLKLDI